jgi:hypothetical protein
MALDQYAYKVRAESVIDDFNYDIGKDFPNYIEIHYWRKHHNLHRWMENLYKEKGGENIFNCCPLRLTLEDLDNLEKYDDIDENDLKFIKNARKVLNEGFALYYDSWW